MYKYFECRKTKKKLNLKKNYQILAENCDFTALFSILSFY